MDTYDRSTDAQQLTRARLQSARELLEDVHAGTDVLTTDVELFVSTALTAIRKALDRYATIPG